MIDADELGPDWHPTMAALDRSIRHRGPDDHGIFTDVHRGEVPLRLHDPPGDRRPRVAFGHRRLSIIDLSDAARQPLVRADGRVFLSYNGEVYNYRELRSELEAEGARFRTTSDTEVILEAYLRWGIDAVRRFRGIFALALADLNRGKVYLVRDPLGVKPLYVGRDGTRWMFSSELKSFLHAGPRRAPDFAALRKYLRFLWIPGSHTGLAGVRKLEPGSWIEIDLATASEREVKYWDALDPAHLAPSYADTASAIEHVRGEVRRAVTEQLVADVPVGAFLSGGLDSSFVVGVMREQGRATQTYSVGYSADDLRHDIVPDDLPFAREASKYFGTLSTELLLSPDVASLLPTLVETLDEPLGDPAALSSYLVCKAAKPLTVMLGGVGADELFGGYPRQRALLYGALYRRAPAWMRRAFTAGVSRMPGAGTQFSAKLGRAAKKFVGAAGERPIAHYVAMETYFSERMQASLLRADGPLAQCADPVVTEAAALCARIEQLCPGDPLKQSMLWDLETYLPSLNLAYTDRTSMAHGVEVRVPFLDQRLVEWSLGARSSDLVRWRRGRLEGKWLLKRAASSIVPERLIWRKKAGFGAPVRSWLRGELAEMRAELLGPRGLGGRGWFEPEAIAALEKEFLDGRQDYSLQIWMLLTLELWARRFLDRQAA